MTRKEVGILEIFTHSLYINTFLRIHIYNLRRSLPLVD